MSEFVKQITKEYYKAQLEAIANDLLNRIDDILEDWDKGIRAIHIETDVSIDNHPALIVKKEYLPMEVYKND